MSDLANYEQVSIYGLDDAAREKLLAQHNECTFMWSTKEGWPVGVIMSYVFKDDCFWLSVSSLRVRVQAVERDPRASISITSKGSSLPTGLSLTYKGVCKVHSDQDTIDWFLPALAKLFSPGNEEAQRVFVELNNTANRRVIQFTPTKTIGFDGRKMGQATIDAVGANVLGTRR